MNLTRILSDIWANKQLLIKGHFRTLELDEKNDIWQSLSPKKLVIVHTYIGLNTPHNHQIITAITRGCLFTFINMLTSTKSEMKCQTKFKTNLNIEPVCGELVL